MSLAFMRFRAWSKEAFKFASVIASACFATSVIGPGTMATDLLAASINDEIAFSACSTLVSANYRICAGTSIFIFWSIIGAPSELVDVVLYYSYCAASPRLDAIEDIAI